MVVTVKHIGTKTLAEVLRGAVQLLVDNGQIRSYDEDELRPVGEDGTP